jgi:hypothetical protein
MPSTSGQAVISGFGAGDGVEPRAPVLLEGLQGLGGCDSLLAFVLARDREHLFDRKDLIGESVGRHVDETA